MKKQLLLSLAIITILTVASTNVQAASINDNLTSQFNADEDSTKYGAKGAADKDTYTLEEMLEYAIQDEYLAFAEYDYIINVLGADRPFTNIIKAEKTHIEALVTLYETLNIVIPSVDPSEILYLPSTIEDAIATGVQAEIDNIAMYESFLNHNLPDEVRETFENLKKASESHLSAFQKNTRKFEGNTNSRGNQYGKNK